MRSTAARGPRMQRSHAIIAIAVLCCASAVAGDALHPAQRLAQEMAAGDHDGITGFVYADRDTVYARHVDAKRGDTPPDLRSATKSITALLVGIAIDRELLPSVQARAVDYLPEYARAFEHDPAKAAITIEDLLTMRSGLDCDDWDPKSPGHEDTMYRRRDWIAFWISRDSVAEPGSRFRYCTGNVIALGKILAQATGQPVDAFAREMLFEPLGITDARWERWNRRREIDSGGHLHLSPDDLLKIGRLVLARGEWNGTRLVSEAWMDAMTQEHTAIPDRPQRYGYLWWLDHTRLPQLPRTRLQMAWGNGGTFLIVLPEIGRVAVFTGERYNRPEALEPMFWMRDRLLPEESSPE